MLWASNIRGLNDEKEVGHAEDVLKHALENWLFQRGVRDQPEVRMVISRLDNLGSKILGHCVASFSEDGDVLSQWRAYGDNGKGISIGFLSTLLEADGKTANFTLAKCLYDREQQYAICSRFWQTILEGIEAKSLIENVPREILEKVETFLYTVGIFLKHPAFVDEREWRLVSSENHLYSPAWRYRATPDGLTSYVELPLPSVFCRETVNVDRPQPPHFSFVVGPQTKMIPTCAVLQAISFAVLGRGVGASLSGIPYSA